MRQENIFLLSGALLESHLVFFNNFSSSAEISPGKTIIEEHISAAKQGF